MIRMALRSFNIQMYCLLGIMLLGWLVTPFSAQFVGISIGLLVSMYCAWILGRRIEKFGNSIVKKEKACPSRSIKKGHAFSFIPAALTPGKNKTE